MNINTHYEYHTIESPTEYEYHTLYIISIVQKIQNTSTVHEYGHHTYYQFHSQYEHHTQYDSVKQKIHLVLQNMNMIEYACHTHYYYYTVDSQYESTKLLQLRANIHKTLSVIILYLLV